MSEYNVQLHCCNDWYMSAVCRGIVGEYNVQLHCCNDWYMSAVCRGIVSEYNVQLHCCNDCAICRQSVEALCVSITYNYTAVMTVVSVGSV